MEIEQLKAQITAKVEECINLINVHKPNFPMLVPTILFELDGLTLGTAHYKTWTVNFNLKFAAHHKEDFLNTTVPHEIAHLADYQYYKKWAHGKTWKHIMRYVFNLEPKTCSSLETPPDVIVRKNKMNTFIYTCACDSREWSIGIAHHKRISSGRYSRCNFCKTRIQFKEFIGKV